MTRPPEAKPMLGIELLLGSFLINILGLAVSVFVIQVMNRYLSHGIDGTLVTLSVGTMLAVILEFCFRTVRIRLANCASIAINSKLGERSFSALINIRGQILLNIPARIRTEILQGLEAVQQATSANNIISIMDVPFAFLYVFFIFLISPAISFISTVFIVIAFLVGLWTVRVTQGGSAELARELNNRRNLIHMATTGGVDTIRAFDGQPFLTTVWRNLQNKIQHITYLLQNDQGKSQNVLQVINATMTVFIIAIGAKLVVMGSLNIGALMGANMLATRALMPIARLAQIGQSLARSRTALQQLEKFNSMPVELQKGTDPKTYEGDLELVDLHYGYPNSAGPLFEGLSLKLPHGSIVAVVGHNGSGKTTLARLLMGLLDPTRGRILADGVDLRQISPWWWRQHVSYLPQEPTFIDGTLKDNILLGTEKMTKERLDAIIIASGLKTWVDNSARGLEEPIFANAHELALGIRRRIALARALATDGRLLVFDEPTEGLDFEGQKAVYAVLGHKLKQGCTVICFSHDPGILKNAHYLIDLNFKPIPRIGMNKQFSGTDGKETGLANPGTNGDGGNILPAPGDDKNVGGEQ